MIIQIFLKFQIILPIPYWYNSTALIFSMTLFQTHVKIATQSID